MSDQRPRRGTHAPGHASHHHFHHPHHPHHPHYHHHPHQHQHQHQPSQHLGGHPSSGRHPSGRHPPPTIRPARGFSEPPRPRNNNTATATAPALWKDLPALPCNYRLGEEGLPWDMGAQGMPEPAADPDDDRLLSAVFKQPTIVPITRTPPPDQRQEDPQRWRRLEDLSAAMMTVDNGFEGQWWNRGGGRKTAMTVPLGGSSSSSNENHLPTPSLFLPPAPPPPPPPPPPPAPCSPLTPGSTSDTISYDAVVSPESDYASLADTGTGSNNNSAWPPLNINRGRSLSGTPGYCLAPTARSDELFFTEHN